MLRVVGGSQFHVSVRRFAAQGAPSAFSDWSKRYDELAKKHPKLFSGDFVKDQESFLSKNYTKDKVSQWHSEYESSRKSIDEATGENVFMHFDLNKLLSSKPHAVNTSVQTKDEALAKLTKGTQYVKELLAAQKGETKSVEEANLKMIKVADYADAIDHWRSRLPDASNDSAEMPLPISDAELDQWVNGEYFHAPEEVRVQTGTFEEHRATEEKWMKELDEKLISKLKERNNKLDEKKLREYLDITNELFHPFKIDHYTFSNYAKALFRSALWQSKDKLTSVEKGVKILKGLLNDKSDNESLILRKMYEEYPKSKFSGLAALQLKMTDPLFVGRLLNEAKSKLEEMSFERAVKDVLRDLELPYILSDKEEAERELAQTQTNTAVLEREVRLLDEKVKSYDMNVPSLESILDDLLPKRLWGNDHTKVKESILNYANGKGSLDDINSNIEAALKPKGENGKLNENEILEMSVRYHNARYSDISLWNLSDFMVECGRVRKEDFILDARRVVKEKLEKLGCDELVINMLRLIIENDANECNRLPQIVNDFEEIMKQWRGEIDATITSAQELDDKTFSQLQKALESANPGKKITMTRAVDAGLQAGFVVKAGVQRFDFSLASAIHEGRKAVGA